MLGITRVAGIRSDFEFHFYHSSQILFVLMFRVLETLTHETFNFSELHQRHQHRGSVALNRSKLQSLRGSLLPFFTRLFAHNYDLIYPNRDDSLVT